MAIRALPVALACLALCACSSETRSSEKRREASYPGGYQIAVIKQDSYTRYRGLVSGQDYGTRHEYSYRFELSPGRVPWLGGSAEPKTLRVCGDRIYLRYLDIELEQRDAGVADAGAADNPRPLRAVERLAELHDERWFFKLFGEVHWSELDPSALEADAACRELAVPNDGELQLGKPVPEP